MLEGLLTILQTLFGWLLYLILSWTLTVVDMLEKMFNIFSGTQTVNYDGESAYLLEIFIGNSAVTNVFWAMAIIGIILSFGFTIVAVARKVTDVTGTTKHTIGQILSQFFKSLLVIVMLNLVVVVSFNVTSVVFDRINFALANSESLSDGYERTYTDEEFAVMTRVLATVGNYSVNPSAESRYNVNACFNAIRGELSTLYLAGCFDYDFNNSSKNETWQSALAKVVKAADLTEDLQLDTYYAPVNDSIVNIFENLKHNPNFKPQKTAIRGKGAGSIDTATMVFLVSSMGAEENEQFRNGNLDDALRRSYISGEKDYKNFSHVFADFAITEINYLVGIIVAGGMLYCFLKTIILFVVRMINLVILYVTSPLFASSMSLDEGARFQGWISSFIMQLLATFGCVVAMRIYLMMVPIVVGGDMDLFGDSNASGFAAALGLEYTAYLFFLLGGAWAVSKANTLIVGVLSNNAASSVLEADSTASGYGWSMTKVAGRLASSGPRAVWKTGMDTLFGKKDDKKDDEKKKKKDSVPARKRVSDDKENPRRSKTRQNSYVGRGSSRSSSRSGGKNNTSNRSKQESTEGKKGNKSTSKTDAYVSKSSEGRGARYGKGSNGNNGNNRSTGNNRTSNRNVVRTERTTGRNNYVHRQPQNDLNRRRNVVDNNIDNDWEEINE
ncbi:MAG: hypothetical protein IKW01_01955 [Firmicutes bacterium]|nr:hypothetical protein [Bacillota bacterium]